MRFRSMDRTSDLPFVWQVAGAMPGKLAGFAGLLSMRVRLFPADYYAAGVRQRMDLPDDSGDAGAGADMRVRKFA